MEIIIDTSHVASLFAILNNDDVLAIKRPSLARAHSKKIISTIEKIFNEADIELKDIDEIICMTGPGSYTGTRVAVSTVNAIAYAQDIVIKPVTLFQIAHEKYKSIYSEYLSIAHARAGHVMMTPFTNGKQGKAKIMPIEDVLKFKLPIVAIDPDKKIKPQKNLEIFEVHFKENIKYWLEAAAKVKKQKSITPFYFQDPIITKSKKK